MNQQTTHLSPASSDFHKRGFSLGKYFRVDTKTIQGRITGSFLLVALVATLMLVFNSLSWRNINQKYAFVVENIYPSKSYISTIRGSLAGTHNLTGQYINARNQTVKSNREEIFNKTIKTSIDSLLSYSTQWDDPVLVREVQQLKLSIESIQALQLKIMEEENQAAYQGSGYLQAYDDLLQSCTRINEKLNKLEKKLIDDANQKKDNITWVMLLQYALAFLISGGIASLILVTLLRRIKMLKTKIREMAAGNLPDEIPASTDELNTITNALNELVANLRNITLFASEVGKGEFESNISVFNNEGQLGQSLAQMRESLKDVAAEDKRRVWINEGVAKFGDIQRSNNQNIEGLTDAIMSDLVKYVGAIQGSIFITEQHEEKGAMLVMKATYAFDRKKYLEKEIFPGQGLVGQCYYEKATIHLSEVPDHYVNITSGLGEAGPEHILIVPMKIEEQVLGVIELASFYKFESHVIAFVERVAENLASTLQSVKINEETTRLLEDSQMKAEQMLAQEEEMRQNLEEMQATQEEMGRLKNQSDYIFDNIDGVVFMCDNDANFTMEFMSNGIMDLVGYPATEFTSGRLSITDLFSEETIRYKKEWIDEPTEKALANDSYYRLEYYLNHKNGDLIHVMEKGKGVRDKHGNMIKLVGFISKL